MVRIDIKPLSVNQAWQGKRFKTKTYIKYRNDLMHLLPVDLCRNFTKNDKLELSIEWGFSSMRSDVDNPAKCFIDALQDKYAFNDSQIYKLNLTKEIVKKGQEYVKFDIWRLNNE